MRPIAFAITLVLAPLALAPAQRAEACGNAVHSIDSRTQLIAQAEGLLESGSYRKALLLAEGTDVEQRVIIDDRTKQNKLRLENLARRRARVAAFALVRLGRFKVSFKYFDVLLKASPDDPALLARYAEALAGTGKAERALQILTDLEKRDVLPDDFARTALANLRKPRVK